MTTEEKVELARRMADRLVALALSEHARRAQGKGQRKGAGEVIRHLASEWTKWSRYAGGKGLAWAIELSGALQSSPSARRDPQTISRCIREVVGQHRQELASLKADDLREVLGYVRRWLVARQLEGHGRRGER